MIHCTLVFSPYFNIDYCSSGIVSVDETLAFTSAVMCAGSADTSLAE